MNFIALAPRNEEERDSVTNLNKADSHQFRSQNKSIKSTLENLDRTSKVHKSGCNPYDSDMNSRNSKHSISNSILFKKASGLPGRSPQSIKGLNIMGEASDFGNYGNKLLFEEEREENPFVRENVSSINLSTKKRLNYMED
mmetsp:Transcript_33045/g.50649  ORF Transcript_33045/g.50649 Transcript_33045/m.50649 type:complete len:141 (+) Transcript_33045:162-584(+)